MSMIYNTNALLSLARLPHHFWLMLNPKEDARNNPGTSIMSYVVAKALALESTPLPKELADNFKRILEFTNQKDMICESIDKRIETVQTVLSNYNGDEKYWDIAIDGSMYLEKIKIKLNDTKIKMTGADANDFTINDQLIHLKTDLDMLKMRLNDAGIPFEWE